MLSNVLKRSGGGGVELLQKEPRGRETETKAVGRRRASFDYYSLGITNVLE
jgi:hypothetical protein